ncbi:MAG TPA: hypothetical protein VFB36_07235 [Nevskiaceae bacterium]|nr:hypothetical protein [Nevskiaceae bacterium]
MRKILGTVLDNLRLIFVVGAGALIAASVLLHQTDTPVRERFVAALSVALAPMVFAWPRLFRSRNSVAVTAAELTTLRRTAAI